MTWEHLPPARFHPELEPGWKNEAEEIGRLARLLGRPLMPWQHKAIAVATQYRNGKDQSGRSVRLYRYARVLITVPRQSGKTTLYGPVQLHRILTRGKPASVWFTAQTGQDARKRMVELIDLVQNSPLKAVFQAKLSNGAEGLRLLGKPGCEITRFSPTLSALHGEHPPLVGFDEIWHYTKELGEALLGAAEPGQITWGSEAQVWMFSTMGTLRSDFMNDLVETGRAGTDPDLCYIDYGLADGLDPLDPASWWTYHPALGNTITEEALAQRARRAAESPEKLATFIRAYGNRLSASEAMLVDMAAWDDLARSLTPPPDGADVVLALEVSPENQSAALVAAWLDAEGLPSFKVVHQAPGTGWLLAMALELAAAEGWQLAADGAGPVRRFVRTLEDEGHEVRQLTVDEFGQATEELLDTVASARGLDSPAPLAHDGDNEVREQVTALEIRRRNGVRRISRDDCARPVPAVIAAVVALYALRHPQVEEGVSFVL
ncbi:terminase large subunit domain-containing protein [Arthrobacter sp. UM1]|uniref:terminase large subunit domain-containing protein n=1 Tax=Arthrobacter sp. UM1 TaxID=2766776 RepID=UPI001CF64C25|nr:terminase family protein [Arthrobacter sp. UM1]MCB4209169.1 hypothetical protein [Arthrobacter sp. UM1]